jgi:hypothetical protein
MLLALATVILACLLMPQVPAFWTTKLLFAATGAGFALIKGVGFCHNWTDYERSARRSSK